MAFLDGTLASERLSCIEEHLATCTSCRGRMMDLLQVTPSGPDSICDRLPGEPYLFEPGDLVARRYRILSTLGRGGMGEVYEAFDSALTTRVALKTTLATQSDSRERVESLLTEARMAQKISHPNVCRSFDFGIHEGDLGRGERLAYVTMELVTGESVGRSVRERGALSIGDIATLGREILDGLSSLHRARLVHRDIKSDNILVRDMAPPGHRAVIIDFGLAVEAGRKRGARSGRSRVPPECASSAPAGTMAYMAPEQLTGCTVTPATDIYGFGVTLFEMLTGRSPFSGRARLAGLAPRLPASLASKAPDREKLDNYLARCLAPSLEARFPHAGAALQAFEQLW